ncbi:DUF4174 domain-containing protein [Pelagicoccus sp. SDUM812003]|uniref:DUF4174 domain-containing protein n=1 Tax=Pelagicoccus sp. SDUM812003 TaxID=3041267 RepID=UPI00280FA817|nr:DUF4174 domain-containing protein [Pelagicoccus sp. SDUM812003]MDQ8202478.1 DUF4174 domain-containing protein [Pelagicoccus sp. SDUM812003]
MAKDPIEALRWEKRIVVYQLESESAREAARARWLEWREDFEERDLVWVNVGKPELSIADGVDLRREQKDEWRRRLAFGEKSGASVEREGASEFVLIGKDGGTKDRQMGELDLPEFFALIDTMPMRLREMRFQRETEAR